MQSFLREMTAYPAAPIVIEQAWYHLTPSIYELSRHHHHHASSFSLAQNVFMAGKPLVKRRGERVDRQQVLFFKSWFYDLLILFGTLPVDASEISDTLNDRGLERVGTTPTNKLITSASEAVSSPSRNEAMMCLDLLCSKVWYARNRMKTPEIELWVLILRSVQNLYWECGVPAQLSELYGYDSSDLNNPLFRDIRALNYRQLYQLYGQGRLNTVFTSCDEGVERLVARRELYGKRFDVETSRDMRWTMSYEQCVESIMRRYSKDESEEQEF